MSEYRHSAPRPPLPSVTAADLHEANLRREQLHAKLAAHQAGQDVSSFETQRVPIPTRRRQNTTAPLFTPADALKVLKLDRKSVKAAPVLAHYQPQHTRAPVVFPYTPESGLSKLSRPVGAFWTQALTSISTTSMGGGKLSGSQGRNLIRIVEELRKRAYLSVTDSGRPVQSREQTVLKVEGEGGHFAAACGMSVSTFYRALKHPLAHLFIRTQKVQRQMPDGDHQNVATLFTVSMYEPVRPPVLEDAYYTESVEEIGIFLLPVLTNQDDSTKERPLTNQIQRSPVDNLKRVTEGLSSAAQTQLQKILDSAPLATKAGAAFDNSGTEGSGAGAAAALDRLSAERPDLYAFAVEVAKHHDSKENRAVAALGYYKALLHLGVGVVTTEIRTIARWKRQGQPITNSGALLMSLLNRKARAKTGFNVRDLGMTTGVVLS